VQWLIDFLTLWWPPWRKAARLGFVAGPALDSSGRRRVVTLLEITMLTLKDTEKVTLSLTAVDAKNQPTAIPGTPSWSSSDTSIAALSVSADGMTATLTAGNEGTARVTVSATLPGVTAPITGILDVTVTAGDAVGITIVAGTPTAQ
jgi:hypothetical protein